jgi:hypothetical protein
MEPRNPMPWPTMEQAVPLPVPAGTLEQVTHRLGVLHALATLGVSTARGADGSLHWRLDVEFR